MNRRNLILGLGAALTAPVKVHALQSCPSPGLPPDVCSVMLDPSRFSNLGVPALQAQTQWCWAACIEMICRWYDLRLSQNSIVQRIYGGLQNMPANDQVLTQALNSVWRSDDNQQFQIRARVFSPAMGISNVDNQCVISDLANEYPLINGSRTHATVVARVDYQTAPNGMPIVQRVHVIDPWPGAAVPPEYARFLQPDEMRPVQSGGSLRYIASIRIS